jgi:hypothetical protein
MRLSTPNESAAHPNQFALLRQRRFAPFFWVQFLGAGNDNLFKFAFTVMVTYQLQVSWLPPALAGLVIGAVFILPYLLFSATSGQIADKVDKAWLIRQLKTLEVAIMALGALGFYTANAPLLLGCLFLMGRSRPAASSLRGSAAGRRPLPEDACPADTAACAAARQPNSRNSWLYGFLTCPSAARAADCRTAATSWTNSR